MNLRLRFFLINLSILLFVFLVILAIFFFTAEKSVKKWGFDLAERQLLYDKTKVVQFLTREITLSQQIAQSSIIHNWAANQDDEQAQKAGLAELERYRSLFVDGNYFIAFRNSGKYYYNNATGKYNNDQYRYTLSAVKESDRWFYDIIAENKDFHINVNPDVYLGVTMLWVDVLIRDKGEILGVIGTGIDLNRFIKKFAEVPDTGVASVFVDHNGAVQVYFDKKYIDFGSISKARGEQKVIQDLFADDAARLFVRNAMTQLAASTGEKVLSRFITFENKVYLAGITYIPELDWYEIALFDPDKLIKGSDLYGILFAFAVALAFSLFMYHWCMQRFVLKPLGRLEKAIDKGLEGDFRGIERMESQEGDVGRILTHFQEMVRIVRGTTEDLEKKVAERTQELERLVKIDPMTELLNRRGMQEVQEKELSRSIRTGNRMGVLWIDIDEFKNINDLHGHGSGDAVIIAVGRAIQQSVRQYDSVSRWGGDEFIALLPECTHETLVLSGERIRAVIYAAVIPTNDKELQVTVSVGGYLAGAGEDMELILNKADKALYQAKANGRNGMKIYEETVS